MSRARSARRLPRADEATRARRWFAPALAGTAILALVLRVASLADLRGSPLLAALMGDARVYDAWARAIAGGDWIGSGVFYQAPLYPYALAVVYRLAGVDTDAVRAVQVLLGCASCVLVGLAGRRFFSPFAGVLAALLLAVYPAAIFHDGLIQKASLDLFLTTLVLALAGEFAAARRWPWIAAAGVAAGALILNRENARLLVPVVWAWLWIGFGDTPTARRATWAAAFTVACLLVLVPVGVRNYVAGGEFLLSTSQLGPNFYIGNNPRATGTYEALVPGRGDAVFERDDATRVASAAAGKTLTPGEVSDWWVAQAAAYIRQEPAAWLRLTGKKLLLTVNAAELPDTESIEAYAQKSRVLRGLGWLDFGVILPLAVFGLWVTRAGWRRLLLLWGSFAVLAASIALFYVVGRYRVPLVPIVALFAAAGIAGSIRWTGDRWRAAWPGVCAAVAAAVLCHLSLLEARDPTAFNLGSWLAQQGRAAEAVPVLEEAARIDPGHAEAHFRLGLARRDAGAAGGAIEALQSAVQRDPNLGDAHGALAIELAQQGRMADALPHFERAAALAPADVSARANLGRALAGLGRIPEAIRALEQARALAASSGPPQAIEDLSRAIDTLTRVRDQNR